MTGGYLRLECVRMLRDPRYLALAVLAPIGFYLLFAAIFGGVTSAGQLRGSVEIMVAMAVYGAVWGALSATAPRLAQERENRWLQHLRALPLGTPQVLAVRIGVGLLVALPALLLVCLTAVVTKDVRLDAGQWAGLVVCLWLGSLPFALLGVALGLCLGAETAFPLSYGLYLVMSALGGLWMPPDRLPSSVERITPALPTYRIADVGWRIAAGRPPEWTDVLVLAGWTLALAAIAILAYRRPRLGRRGAAATAST